MMKLINFDIVSYGWRTSWVELIANNVLMKNKKPLVKVVNIDEKVSWDYQVHQSAILLLEWSFSHL